MLFGVISDAVIDEIGSEQGVPIGVELSDFRDILSHVHIDIGQQDKKQPG